jgi:hypothetical protein
LYQRVALFVAPLQILPQFGHILFPFCCFAALPPLRVDPFDCRVQRELRRFQVAAARGDVRVVQVTSPRIE